MAVHTAAAHLLAALHIASLMLTYTLPTTAAARTIAADTALTTSSSKATASRFPALFTFGDSIFDTGNNNVLPTTTRCDFPPYGRDFPLHQATGRFSNGRVPPDMIASAMGIKELLPPYLSTTNSTELLTGVSFASGGTGFDPLTSELASVLSMSQQLDLFREYKGKIVAIAGKDRADSLVADSMYSVCAGSNDVASTYFVSPFRRSQYNVSSYVAFLVGSASNMVQELYHLGAKNIGVLGLPPLGCVPTQRTLGGGSNRECASTYNEASIQYNTQLSQELQRLQQKLQDAKIVFVDIYPTLLDVIQRPSTYGFKEATKGCCGTGELEMMFLCNSLIAHTCNDDSYYVFWDSVHPTEKAYDIIIREVKDKYLSLF